MPLCLKKMDLLGVNGNISRAFELLFYLFSSISGSVTYVGRHRIFKLYQWVWSQDFN